MKNIFQLSTNFFYKSIVKNFFNEIIILERQIHGPGSKIKSALSSIQYFKNKNMAAKKKAAKKVAKKAVKKVAKKVAKKAAKKKR